MQAFADLYAELDGTTRTQVKLDALMAYFRTAPPADAAWAVYILSGRRMKRLIG
jgi:DNA ligase-1